MFVYGLGQIGAINQNLLTETGALVLLGVLAKSHRMAICCHFDTKKEIAPTYDRKNDGANCMLETRRTSGCDDDNIPLGMKCGRIQDPLVTALQSGLCFFFFRFGKFGFQRFGPVYYFSPFVKCLHNFWLIQSPAQPLLNVPPLLIFCLLNEKKNPLPLQHYQLC